MFEARLTQAQLLRKLVDAIKDLVVEANLDVASDGISLQVCVRTPIIKCSMKMAAGKWFCS